MTFQVAQQPPFFVNLDPDWTHFDTELEALVDLEPFFDHEGDSGSRLYAHEDVILVPFVPTKIRHGIAVTPREGYAFDIRGRSGSAFKKHIQVELGTVDRPYTGELCTVATYRPPLKTVDPRVDLDQLLTSLGFTSQTVVQVREFALLLQAFGVASFDPTPYVVARGERVSQLVEVAVCTARGQRPFTRVPALGETTRGAKGFNSTSEKVA